MRWMHIVACSDGTGCCKRWGRGVPSCAGFCFCTGRLGKGNKLGVGGQPQKINLSKTDLRAGLVGLKVDGGGGQQTQSGASPKLKF